MNDKKGDIRLVITDVKMLNENGMILINKIDVLYAVIRFLTSASDLSSYDFQQLIERKKILAALKNRGIMVRQLNYTFRKRF